MSEKVYTLRDGFFSNDEPKLGEFYATKTATRKHIYQKWEEGSEWVCACSDSEWLRFLLSSLNEAWRLAQPQEGTSLE